MYRGAAALTALLLCGRTLAVPTASLSIENADISVTLDPSAGLTALVEKKAAEAGDKPLTLALSTDSWAVVLSAGSALETANATAILLSSTSCAPQPAKAKAAGEIATLVWDCASQGYSVSVVYELPADGGAFLTKTLRIASEKSGAVFTVGTVTPW